MKWPRITIKETHNPDRTEIILSLPYLAESGGINPESGGINEGLNPESGTIKPRSGTIKPESGTINAESGTINETINETIRLCPGISLIELAEKVGKSRTTVARTVANLKLQGVIEYRGSKKTGGYYTVSKTQ
jgi:biotin operon repressor